jgi:hypothetical protein
LIQKLSILGAAMAIETIPLPPRSQVGYLDPLIAGEGVKVEYANGEPLAFTPAPTRPNYPDWSEIKSIQKYFNRTGYEPWPAWFYHPTEQPRIVLDQVEGEKIGVWYRKPTADEVARFGVMRGVWDWAPGCEWRPTPYVTPKFDPKNPGHGKEFVDPMRDSATANRFMVQEIAKAIGQTLHANGPAAPATVDPHMWQQFLQFMAWQKTNEAVGAAQSEDIQSPNGATSIPSAVPAQGNFGALDAAMSTLQSAANGEPKSGKEREKKR